MSVMGKNIYMWRDGAFQSIEFVVTQECNMRCKYCYMIGKNDKNRLSIETAKKAIDYILSDDMLFEQDALAINFIGGEPLLEIELIDQICDYFKIKMYEKNHKWFNLFMINIGSNGLLYDSPKVQKFLQKNKGKVSLNITIDGTKEKHDLQRVYPNGEGTHADVLRNVKLWLKQAPLAMTKVTIGHDDMDYLKDSIIYLWNIGMNEVPANIVFEDVWKEGDDIRYYTQLRELADYVVDNHLWDKYNTTLFSERLGLPLSKIDLSGRECGSGGMITIDASGRFYPCVRFMDYSLENQESISIGDSENGLNFEKIRAFVNCDLAHQSDKECLNCTVASECSYCLAHNYDISGTLFRRNKHICKMHKARVRANNYYWARLENALGKVDREKAYYKQNLFIMLSDDSSIYCNYSKPSIEQEITRIGEDVLLEAADFTENEFFNPILLHSNDSDLSDKAIQIFKNQRTFNLFEHDSKNIFNGENNVLRKIKSVTHKALLSKKIIDTESTILIVDDCDLKYLAEDIERILYYSKKVNLILHTNYKNIDYQEYESQLNKVIQLLYNYTIKNEEKQVDVITDHLFSITRRECEAGVNSFTLAPNGKIYVCPAVYFATPNNYIGSVKEGIDKDKLILYSVDESPVCSNCSVKQCKRCFFLNKEYTGEYNTPSTMQCKKSKIEERSALKLYKMLKEYGFDMNINDITNFSNSDPMEQLVKERGNLRAYKYPNLL